MAGEEPLGRPRAEAADRDQPGADLVVVSSRERVEIDRIAGEAEHVLGFAVREAEREQLFLVPAATLSRVGNA